MRTILLLALTTTIACETVDEDTAENQEETDQNSDTQAKTNWDGPSGQPTVNDDFAGGMPHVLDGFSYYHDVLNPTDDGLNKWGGVPMNPGHYDAIVEEVFLAQCHPVKPADEFRAGIRPQLGGTTALNGGLLENKGNTLRFRRVKEAPYKDVDGCVAIEITKGNGMMDRKNAMAMDLELTLMLEGDTCPAIDPCTDAYSAYFEHESLLDDGPVAPELDVDFDFELEDSPTP